MTIGRRVTMEFVRIKYSVQYIKHLYNKCADSISIMVYYFYQQIFYILAPQKVTIVFKS